MQLQEMLFPQAVVSILCWQKKKKKKNGVDAKLGRGTVTIVFVTPGEVIIPECIRMLSVEKLQ